LSNINFLEEYSKFYNTVEIDQWFWSLGQKGIRLPSEKDVHNYNLSTPDEFRFTIKIPNSITLTHFYEKPIKANEHFLSKELFTEFLEKLEPLHSKIGVLMFQFEYLNKQKMSSVEYFIEKLNKFFSNIPKSYSFGIEIRNPNYLNKKFFEFIHDTKLVMVFLQGYYMPAVWDVYNKYSELIKEKVVIRLHGPNRKGIEETTGGDWSKIVEPKDAELREIISIIKKLENNKIDIYLNVNNHYEGSAPLTIEKIKNMIYQS